MSRASTRAAQAALISGLVLTVASFGGTNGVSLAAVETLFFVVAAWIALQPSVRPGILRPRHFAVPSLLVAVALLQLCPLPAGLTRALRGAGASGDSHWGILSIVPYQTRSELLILLACSIAFILAVLSASERRRKLFLVRSIAVLGASEACYGLIQYLTHWQMILWYPKRYDLEEATGTYVNRNHFAGLLEMILPFAVCLALYEGEKVWSTRRRRDRRRLGSNWSNVVLWLAVAVVLAAALVFSRSRMGMLAAAASLVVVVGLIALARRLAPTAVAIVFLILSFSFAAWIGVRPAFTRFETVRQEFSGPESRLSIWPGAAALIRAHPFLGTGLGTFPVAYTPFQTTFLTEFVNHAHNDYLETASDLGIPAAAVLFLSIGVVAASALRRFLVTASRFERYVSLACVGSIAAILLHSLADFNLHIPANALMLATILGIAVAPVSGATAEVAA
ncbi:MAG TPA: O-antigen ligase family protein [Candidatus Cybelea sp.]|nr:O-antigen ligase family protein [Candidatus Cybelea sp.]